MGDAKPDTARRENNTGKETHTQKKKETRKYPTSFSLFKARNDLTEKQLDSTKRGKEKKKKKTVIHSEWMELQCYRATLVLTWTAGFLDRAGRPSPRREPTR